MQATMESPGVPATMRPGTRALGVSRGREVADGVVDVPSRPVLIAEASRAEESKTRGLDSGLATFMNVRPSLLGMACRVLGSMADAEDIVQEVWVRWQTADRTLVRNAAAFLMTSAVRLAINVVQSARWRRETKAKPRLPEPVDTSADSGLEAERRETLKLGVQILLEKLSPTERAAYILREAFDYKYRDIATVLRIEEANARQVVTRARQHVSNGRRRPSNATEQRRLLDSFIAAAQRGDVAGLESLLASKSCPRRPAGSKNFDPQPFRRFWPPAGRPTEPENRRKFDFYEGEVDQRLAALSSRESSELLSQLGTSLGHHE